MMYDYYGNRTRDFGVKAQDFTTKLNSREQTKLKCKKSILSLSHLKKSNVTYWKWFLYGSYLIYKI